MLKSTRTHGRIDFQVVISGSADSPINVIQTQCIPHFPGDNVIRTRQVAANPQTSNKVVLALIQSVTFPLDCDHLQGEFPG